MSTNVLGSAFFIAVTLLMIAVTPPVDPPAASQHVGAVTLEGCLLREADVAGRTGVAERRAPGEDYVLTKVRLIEGTVPEPALTATTTDGVRGLPMFRVAGLSQAELQSHVGQRVEIDGAFHRDGRLGVSAERRLPADELQEIHATALRQLARDCIDK